MVYASKNNVSLISTRAKLLLYTDLHKSTLKTNKKNLIIVLLEMD